MKVILDTNILVSALLVPTGAHGAVYTVWVKRHFTLLTSKHQLLELRRTLAKPALAARIHPIELAVLSIGIAISLRSAVLCRASNGLPTRMTISFYLWRKPVELTSSSLATRVIYSFLPAMRGRASSPRASFST